MATLPAVSFSAKLGSRGPTLSWKAKPETLDKVMSIVKTQLVLADDAAAALAPESKFTDLGTDSLDMVEIVMALEEFKITVEEDNAQNITTVQEAADLIDQLVESKPAAA